MRLLGQKLLTLMGVEADGSASHATSSSSSSSSSSHRECQSDIRTYASAWQYHSCNYLYVNQ